MSRSPEAALRFVAGRLALDFINIAPRRANLSWDQLVAFLECAEIITAERGGELLALSRTDPQSAESLLGKAQRLGSGLRLAFDALLNRQRILREWVEPVNEILRVTEGHEELLPGEGAWKIEFLAREGGLEWLLAAVARSAAETIAEGPQARLRLCANPRCGLFFYDTSRTHRRRWCSMTVCGNRSKVAAFARRHASASRSKS